MFNFDQLKKQITDVALQLQEATREISLEMFGIVDCFRGLLHPDSSSNVRRHLLPDLPAIFQARPSGD